MKTSDVWPSDGSEPTGEKKGTEYAWSGLPYAMGKMALPTPTAREPEKLRCIRYYDAPTEKTFASLTNNFFLPALTIADLYRCRWQVELFFKWIKQHLRIKAFFGTSENAVKKPDLDRRVGLHTRGYHQKTAETRG